MSEFIDRDFFGNGLRLVAEEFHEVLLLLPNYSLEAFTRALIKRIVTTYGGTQQEDEIKGNMLQATAMILGLVCEHLEGYVLHHGGAGTVETMLAFLNHVYHKVEKEQDPGAPGEPYRGPALPGGSVPDSP